MPLYPHEGETAKIMALAPVIPVLTVASVEDGLAQAKALVAGGLYAIEVTLRTPAALEAIKAIAKTCAKGRRGGGHDRFGRPDQSGGRGRGQVSGQSGRSGGARQGRGAVAGSVPAGMRDGFGSDGAHGSLASARSSSFRPKPPAGAKLLASLAAPLPDLRFCPTGGIDLQKAPEYLRLPNVPCVGGSWMLQKAALAAGDYLAVEALSRDAAGLKRAAA